MLDFNPTSRHTDLVIQEVPGELLIYDTAADKAHCLNASAAVIWKACDGKTSVADIARAMNGSLGPIDADVVSYCIDELRAKNLMVGEIHSSRPRLSRRNLLKKVGHAAVIGLPVTASLATPRSALANLTCGCTNNIQCTLPPCPANSTCGPLGTCVT